MQRVARGARVRRCVRQARPLLQEVFKLFIIYSIRGIYIGFTDNRATGLDILHRGFEFQYMGGLGMARGVAPGPALAAGQTEGAAAAPLPEPGGGGAGAPDNSITIIV